MSIRILKIIFWLTVIVTVIFFALPMIKFYFFKSLGETGWYLPTEISTLIGVIWGSLFMYLSYKGLRTISYQNLLIGIVVLNLLNATLSWAKYEFTKKMYVPGNCHAYNFNTKNYEDCECDYPGVTVQLSGYKIHPVLGTYILPKIRRVEPIKADCNTLYFSEANPIIWFQLTNNGSCNQKYILFNQPGPSPLNGTPLLPITSEIANELRSCNCHENNQNGNIIKHDLDEIKPQNFDKEIKQIDPAPKITLINDQFINISGQDIFIDKTTGLIIKVDSYNIVTYTLPNKYSNDFSVPSEGGTEKVTDSGYELYLTTIKKTENKYSFQIKLTKQDD